MKNFKSLYQTNTTVVETKNPPLFLDFFSTYKYVVHRWNHGLESKFNIFQVKYSHYEASLKKVEVPAQMFRVPVSRFSMTIGALEEIPCWICSVYILVALIFNSC